MKFVNASKTVGPYSQGVIFADGKLVQTCGLIPLGADGEVVEGGIEEQTRQTLKNVEDVLKAAGTGKENIIKTTIFLSDLTTFTKMNEVYAEFMGEHRPARSTIEVSGLPKGVLLEIDAIAEIR
jgi:2-iminobutanoate/2-iminopropanoate deaminase